MAPRATREDEHPASYKGTQMMAAGSRQKKILVLAYDDITVNPRPERQIRWLQDEYDVEYVAQKANPDLQAGFIEHRATSGLVGKLKLFLLKLGLYDRYIWNRPAQDLAITLDKKGYDAIIAHHLKLLPIAFRIAKGAPVVFDAHEYYTELYNDSPVWNFFMKGFFTRIAKDYLHRCRATIAVNESIQNLYEKNFHIRAGHLTNAADYVDLQPSAVDPGHIKIIHHGLASPSRKLELMIQMARHLDERFTLTFILLEINYTSRSYVRRLKRMASGRKNILFLDLLPPRDLIPFCRDYDIGLFFMPPSNMNEEYSLANKFFQYVQSRLALAVSPLVEMKRLVEKYEIGVVSEDYDPLTLARKLNLLTAEEIMRYKNQSHRFARELSSDANRDKFLRIVEEVVDDPNGSKGRNGP
jgi:hypothetical protein